ncbi:Reverse transcriptase (RNA-dependent DNA polymerase) [Marinospirillum alkaliphilum DSM 21637]|uniref:Reverse transcriptase (RNA-dependent DNA polymerase) n=2 Tax=Marinospirillum TaxID=64968 RepID=A0A1K1W1U4_9GAMM|nr:Reverse transcriptase (RNA-dependent DNA polymerase) [Marinospirillum alkaliphilum DSM 21637]
MWRPPDYYFNHQKGGHVAALKLHTESEYFFKIDIKRFFDSINKTRVTRNLKELFGYEIARAAASKSTVPMPNSLEKRFILPFGFIQSPIISALCLRKSHLGNLLHKIRENKRMKVSVYVDDIIVSSSKKHLKELTSIYFKSVYACEKSGFLLNNEKSQKPEAYVNSFNITTRKKSMTINESRMAEFRKTLHETKNKFVVDGVKNYVDSINDWQSSTL